MKIIQILTKQGSDAIYGLGDDNNVYTWGYKYMQWEPTWDVDVNVAEGLPRTDPTYTYSGSGAMSNVKMLDVYETWGKIPLSLITGKTEDANKEVEGHIVVSGLDSPGKERCHLIEKNTKQTTEGEFLKPYEECWFTRVPNRWYGRGVAEKLLTLQIYANIVFNVRINRSRISQLGLFKIKKGAGITPQMLSRLPSNGAVVMNNLDDMEQMVVQDVSQSSYTDESVINSLSERLTNAFEVVTGEGLPSSTSATANAIQNQNAKSGFSMIIDGIGSFLERWIDRHALPIIAKELDIDDIVRITADEESFKDLVDRVLLYKAADALDDSFAKGYIPSEEELFEALEDAREKMGKSDMFVKLVQKLIADQVETQVYVTNEQMDVAVTVQNLINMLNVAPEYRDAILRQAFDLMGLTEPKLPRQITPSQPGMVPPPTIGVPGLGAGGGVQQGATSGQALQQMTTTAMTQ